jgi:hypothetical protein
LYNYWNPANIARNEIYNLFLLFYSGVGRSCGCSFLRTRLWHCANRAWYLSPERAQGETKKRHASPDAIKKRQLSVLKKEAALTVDQESKVTPIISKYVDDVVALKNDTSLVGAAKREKRKTLHTQYVNDIDAVLTPDQQKSWAAANTARLERLRSARATAKPSASAGENE